MYLLGIRGQKLPIIAVDRDTKTQLDAPRSIKLAFETTNVIKLR